MSARFVRVLAAAVVLSAADLASAGAAGGPVYYLTAQVHPRFEVAVELNGSRLKRIVPSSDAMKASLKQIDGERLRRRGNELRVDYRRRGADTADPPGPSFRIRIKRQEDPTDSATATVLVEMRGPSRPFEQAAPHGTFTRSFDNPP